MKKLTFIILILSCFYNCKKDGKTIGKVHEKAVDSSKINYYDAEKSSFTLYESDIINGLKYSPKYVISEINYEVFRILDTTSKNYNMTYHIAKINKVSELVNGAEGGLVKISAEIRNFNNPTNIEFTIKETEGNEIQFEPNLYRIVQYGCCDSNGWIKLYSYQQKLIAEGNPTVINNKYPVW
ncbi:hypothetical protein C8N46_11078 [Kordia periserrulae]|uniref:Uncharacterized protein n=1 Tax=Kordia periserrulae TaxID=701523 RepID=A0A2T6BT34_9FLAO|nr:hypothetical protein [Kordia periserrulae]PTX59241.1 hypothetical protein C8N46_11078 [Kordia periserrulae]